MLSNHDSRHGEDAGGFGIVMPCDVEAEEARVDFNKLREAATTSLDAAAKSWSEMCVARGKQQEAGSKSEEPVQSAEEAASPNTQPAPPKPRRKARRKRSVA